MAAPADIDSCIYNLVQSFTPEFELATVASYWRDPLLTASFAGKLKGGFFQDSKLAAIVGMIDIYWNRYGELPSESTLIELIRKSAPDDTDAHVRQRETLTNQVKKLVNADISNTQWRLEQISEWLKWSATYEAVQSTIDDLQAGKGVDGGLVQRFEQAIQYGAIKLDPGLFVSKDAEKTLRDEVNPDKRLIIPTGIEHLDQMINGGGRAGELVSFLAPPKGFKCSAEHQPVMMFDGSIKLAKDVMLGDLLMGDDSTPRRVLQVGKGRGPMYRIEQSNGDTYEVTADHVLCLKRPPNTTPILQRYHTEEILEITAKEYSRQKPWFQRTWKGYKVGVEFQKRPTPVDPYYIGLWAGDGHNHNLNTISVGDDDPEIKGYLGKLAKQFGLKITIYQKTRTNRSGERVRAKCQNLTLSGNGGSNPIIDALRSVGLGYPASKHIPDLYRVNDRETRLQVLAGMIDSDGHFSRVKGFVFSNVNKRLCDDACWLARSLGFKSHVISIKAFRTDESGVKHYHPAFRTLIQGKVSEIPTKILRKRGKDSVRVSERTAIKVTPIGDGNWCGWLTDGNHRYLMGDFTVTHNSGTLLNIGWNARKVGIDKTVVYLTLELSEQLQLLRFAQRTTLTEKERLYENPNDYVHLYHRNLKTLHGPKGDFIIKFFPPHQCTPNTIRRYLDGLSRQGIEVGVLCVDYLDLLGSDHKKEKDYLEKLMICTDLRQVAIDYHIPVWTAARATREAIGKKRINMSHMSGSIERVAVCDMILALSQTDEERVNGQIRICPVAARNDAGNKIIHCRFEPSKMLIQSVEARDMDDEDFEDEEEGSKGARKKMKEHREKGRLEARRTVDD